MAAQPPSPSVRTRRVCWYVVVSVVVASWQASLAAEPPRSAALARQLTTLLAERKLDAYAVKHPDSPDEFIAVLFFPNVQLLVVSARPMSPAAVDAQLANKQYADVYSVLHQASIRETKVFFHDMKADGLQAQPVDAADIEYERVAFETVFDGSPSNHQMTDRQYTGKFAAADARYSRLLAALVAGLKKP